MRRVDFAVIAIRILALGMGVRAFVLIGSFGVEYFYGRSLSSDLLSTMPAAVLCEIVVWPIAAIYCRQRAEKLAWGMFDDEEEATSPAQLGLTAEDFATVGCILVGVFTLVPALRLLLDEGVVYVTHKLSWEEYWAERGYRARLLALVLKGALGAWLVFGARNAVRRLVRPPTIEPHDAAGDASGTEGPATNSIAAETNS